VSAQAGPASEASGRKRKAAPSWQEGEHQPRSGLRSAGCMPPATGGTVIFAIVIKQCYFASGSQGLMPTTSLGHGNRLGLHHGHMRRCTAQVLDNNRAGARSRSRGGRWEPVQLR